jgi:surfeit locus 1 family protein
MTASDWGFARRPSWIASHLFALVVICAFVALGLWQLDRLGQRQALNDRIEDRAARAPSSVAEALAAGTAEELDYVAVADTGRYLAADQVAIRNRSQGGAAGSWIVTPLVTDSGPTILVNRGFVPQVMVDPDTVAVPSGPVAITGYLRQSQERGAFGPQDHHDGRLPALARVDVGRIDAQVGAGLAPMWLQVATQDPPPPGGLPDPVPLPPLGEGSHLAYAVQWFIFASLGVVVYGLLLRRRAREAAAPPLPPGRPVPAPAG